MTLDDLRKLAQGGDSEQIVMLDSQEEMDTILNEFSDFFPATAVTYGAFDNTEFPALKTPTMNESGGDLIGLQVKQAGYRTIGIFGKTFHLKVK